MTKEDTQELMPEIVTEIKTIRLPKGRYLINGEYVDVGHEFQVFTTRHTPDIERAIEALELLEHEANRIAGLYDKNPYKIIKQTLEKLKR